MIDPLCSAHTDQFPSQHLSKTSRATSSIWCIVFAGGETEHGNAAGFLQEIRLDFLKKEEAVLFFIKSRLLHTYLQATAHLPAGHIYTNGRRGVGSRCRRSIKPAPLRWSDHSKGWDSKARHHIGRNTSALSLQRFILLCFTYEPKRTNLVKANCATLTIRHLFQHSGVE